MRGMETQLEKRILAGDEIYTSWRAQLSVTMAPLLFHERRFIITANDGRRSESISFALDVRPTAAPDIYLLIGQSNMEGNSELGTRDTSIGGFDEPHQRILQLNVKQNNRQLFHSAELFIDESFNVMEPRYIPAEDPLHEPRFPYRENKEGSFIGLGLSFAKAALPFTTQEIILVPAAWSARGFCANDDPALAWNASELHADSALGGTLLTERALTRLNMALRDKGGVLRGILWHQGEADADNPVCAERYEGNLIKLAQRLRRDASADARGAAARGDNAAIPFILGTMSRGKDAQGDFSIYSASKQRVDDAHRNIPNQLPHSDLANADDLVPDDYPCGQNSCIHFGARALREFGSRYYAALSRIIDRAQQ